MRKAHLVEGRTMVDVRVGRVEQQTPSLFCDEELMVLPVLPGPLSLDNCPAATLCCHGELFSC